MKQLRLLFLITLGLGPAVLQADPKVDSLLKVLKIGDDKAKTDALNELCLLFCYSEPVKAKKYAFEALNTSGNYPEGLAKAHNRLGMVYDVTGNYDSAVTCYNEALKRYEVLNYPKGTGSACNNLGLIKWKRGQLNEAIVYFSKAIPCFEQTGNKEYLANVYNNMSLVCEQTKDHRKAISYALRSVRYHQEAGSEENIGDCYLNLCVSYMTIRLLDSAKYYIEKAIACHTKYNHVFGLSIDYNDYGNLMAEFKDFKKAQEYYFRSLKLKQEMNEEEGIASVYLNIFDNYKSLGDEQQALAYLFKAKELSEKMGFLSKLQIVYKNLALAYQGKQMPDSALIYMQLAADARDSIYTQEFKTSLADAHTRYETKEKELTIQKQDYEIAKKNNYILALGSALFVIALASYALVSRYRFRQQARLQAEIMRQQELSAKAVILAEENERRRVAADLHDSVGQMLSAIKLNLSAFGRQVEPEQAPQFEKIVQLTDESCKEIRSISHNLMPNSLLKNGLVSAVREFIGQIDQEALKIDLVTNGLDARTDTNTELVLYRVIQECVNNVIKHAKATQLDIQLNSDAEGISVTIEDNGSGFDQRLIPEGIGLKNMRSRIEFLKGSLEISSAFQKGTLVAIFIPKAG